MIPSAAPASTGPARSPARPGLAAVLRDETQAIHREAERAGFIADLIRGRATRAGYALFLRNLLPVYQAMEAALAALPPRFAAFRDMRLRRGEVLAADLFAIAGVDALSLPLVPAAERYVAAVTAATEPQLLAHAYARYLGDLSGGQILAPLITRALAVPPEHLLFYRFDEIADIAAQKALMRDALDSLDPAGDDAVALVGEAVRAFQLNIDLSLAVQALARAEPASGG